MSHKKVEYRTVPGKSVRVQGRTLSGQGESQSGAEADAIRQYAGVRDSFGQPAYFVILSDEKGADGGGAAAGQAQSKPQDPPALTFTLPEGTSEKQARDIVGILERQGHTLETANLLSDTDLDALDGIAEGRRQHIRALGTANGYPAFTPPAE